MPQKRQLTKEKITEGALSLLRREGSDTLNARAIAKELGVSTQPIYLVFSGMEELYEALRLAAYQYYLAYTERAMKSGEFPAYKASGMAYIRFAKEERELFRFLFLRDRRGERVERTVDDFDEAVIESILANNDFDRESAYRLHMQMWTVAHGIATMIATSFYPWEEGEISRTLTMTYFGVREQLLKEFKEKTYDGD